MSEQVVTVTRAESAEVEEEGDARATASNFQPQAPISHQPAAYKANVEYNTGDYVTAGGGIYRSQVDDNEGNDPTTDAAFANWTPAQSAFVPLVNPAYNDGPVLQHPGTPYP